MTPRVVVTGTAGFVGSRVAARLVAGGCGVVGIDSFTPAYARSRKEAALARIPGAGFQFVEGDVTDARAATLFVGADVVVHAAGWAGVRSSLAEPAAAGRANAGALAAVLAHCVRAGVRRIVTLSSSSVYGEAPTPFREDAGWLRPRSPYAASKRAGELLLLSAARRGAVVAVLRLFSVYGPGQRPDQAAWRFAERLARGEPVEQYGDGSARRDFTFVEDVAEAVERAVAWTATGHGALTVNVGAGVPTRLDAFRAALAERLGATDRVRELAPAAGDVTVTWADTRRAADALGWTPRTRLADGLAAFAAWFEVTHGRSAGTTARPGA